MVVEFAQFVKSVLAEDAVMNSPLNSSPYEEVVSLKIYTQRNHSSPFFQWFEKPAPERATWICRVISGPLHLSVGVEARYLVALQDARNRSLCNAVLHAQLGLDFPAHSKAACDGAVADPLQRVMLQRLV